MSKDLSALIFKELDKGRKIDWSKRRRCTGLLIRAVYALIEGDAFLSTVKPSDVSPRNHTKIFDQVKAYASGKRSIADDTEWKLWSVSSCLHDAQHRLAATFDRCIGYWMTYIGYDNEKYEDENGLGIDRVKGLDGAFHPWIGSRLVMLQLLLHMCARIHAVAPRASNKQAGALHAGIRTAREKIDEIVAAMTYSDTIEAAKVIGSIDENIFERHHDQVQMPVSVAPFVSKLRVNLNNDMQPVSDALALVIVLGRVNEFKHRVHARSIWKERHFRYHVEFALTVQCLFAIVEFYKMMDVFFEKVPLLRQRD